MSGENENFILGGDLMDKNMVVLYSRTLFDMSTSQKARFNELLKMAKLLNDRCMDGEKMLTGFTNLIGDTWYSFYSKEPILKGNAQQVDEAQYEFIANLLKNDEYIQWHQLTKGDELLSVLTAISMADQFIKRLKNDHQHSKNAQKQKSTERTKEFAKKRIQELQQQMNSASSESMKKAYKQQQKMYEHSLKNAQQQSTTIEQQVKNQLIEISKQSLGQIIQENKQKISNTKKAIVTVGTMDGKKIEHVPLRDQFELAEKIGTHKELQTIADLVGRFKRIAMKKQKTKQKHTMERKNIAIGQEVSRLLPTELANYVMGHSKQDFLRRFSESQAFVFDTKGKDRKGKGPIIICMDESSSMTSIKEQSKAFCIALLTIAKKQKRDFAIVPFASKVGEVKIFAKGQASTQDLLAFSNSFLGGGTNYEQPLRESLNILLQSEFNEADILFVTDGSSFLPTRFIEEFNATKKKKQFECTSVVLTNLFNAVDVNLVKKFSDRVIEVGELFDAAEAFVL